MGIEGSSNPTREHSLDGAGYWYVTQGGDGHTTVDHERHVLSRRVRAHHENADEAGLTIAAIASGGEAWLRGAITLCRSVLASDQVP
jgi:hypothetical protein